MTNDEAIKWLDELKVKIDIPKAAISVRKKNEALDMAISALESSSEKPNKSEPCEDAVSREAVLGLAYDMSEIDGEHFTEPCMVVDVEDIQKLPSVTQQTGEWINVNDRMPTEAYGCLVTVYDTDLRTQDEFENILPYFVGYDGETWNNFCGEPIPFEVIAWMPLPEPYKAGR